MATLADSFLADLDDLSDDEETPVTTEATATATETTTESTGDQVPQCRAGMTLLVTTREASMDTREVRLPLP